MTKRTVRPPKLSNAALTRLKRQAAARKARAARVTKQKRKEAQGKVVLKRVGNRKAYHVKGVRKTGIHRFLAKRVVSKRSVRNTVGFTPLTTAPAEVFARAAAPPGTQALTSYQKGLRGRRRGTHIHKQFGRAIKLAATRKPTGRKTTLHPMVATAFSLLARCGYVPLMADAGVYIGNYATELDLVCYKKGGSKNVVTPIEIKTGFEDIRDYTRPRYRMRIGGTKAARASSKVLCSKRDRDFMQLLSSVIACSASRPEWEIDEALLLNIRAGGSELLRIPDSIITLRPALEFQLRAK